MKGDQDPQTPWEQHLAANPDVAVFCEADEAEDAGEFRRAIQLFKRSAEMGCVPAFARIGTLYDDRIAKPRPDLAVYWYKRGVRSGSYIAAQNLAMHYRMLGKKRWYAYWLKRAVDMGDEDSRHELDSLT